MGYTKIIRSGTLVEIYEYKKEVQEIRPRRKKLKGFHTRNISRRHDNVLRTTKAIRRLIRSNLDRVESPALLTCTMYEILPVSTSWKAYTIFQQRLRKLYGKQIKYVAVLEFQKRGAVHFHALVWGLPEHVKCEGYYDRKKRKFIHKCHESKLCERRTRRIQHQWLRGWCDCIVTDGSTKLAGYITKYLRKQMPDKRLAGQKAYSTSRNMLRPMSAGGNTMDEYIDQFVDIHSKPLHHHVFDTEWLGQCTYKAYENTYGNASNQPQSDN